VIRLSTKSRYGLRILLQIAQDNREGHLASGRVIAERQEITEPYMEQIMIPLKAGKLVKTRRGCRGGYELARAAEAITVLEVVELFEGRFDLVNCDDPEAPCSRRPQCPTYPVWKNLSDASRRVAAEISVASLLPPADGTPAGHYCI
jgi:Rrf2 family protein